MTEAPRRVYHGPHLLQDGRLIDPGMIGVECEYGLVILIPRDLVVTAERN
jgi:hypothetical protein